MALILAGVTVFLFVAARRPKKVTRPKTVPPPLSVAGEFARHQIVEASRGQQNKKSRTWLRPLGFLSRLLVYGILFPSVRLSAKRHIKYPTGHADLIRYRGNCSFCCYRRPAPAGPLQSERSRLRPRRLGMVGAMDNRRWHLCGILSCSAFWPVAKSFTHRRNDAAGLTGEASRHFSSAASVRERWGASRC